MVRPKIRLPFIDIPVMVMKMAEKFVDDMAAFFEKLIPEEDPKFRKALAYALVGDLIASPCPPPFDTPLDLVVQDRLRELLPESDKYRRMVAKVAEGLPYIELLPNYTLMVLWTKREKELE